mgnify:CR=1 FL=1
MLSNNEKKLVCKYFSNTTMPNHNTYSIVKEGLQLEVSFYMGKNKTIIITMKWVVIDKFFCKSTKLSKQRYISIAKKTSFNGESD